MWQFSNLGNNPLWAQAAALSAGSEDMVGLALLVQHLIAVVVFSVVGVIVFAVSLYIIEKLTPFSIIKEIGEEQNVAVSILVGAIVLGISMIIGASILG